MNTQHPDHQLRVQSDETGCLWYEGDPANPRPTSPMEYLALALGGCLLFFSRRFFSRRDITSDPEIMVFWRVDTHGLNITTMRVSLTPPVPLSESEAGTLRRMLDQCPIHRALAATPIDVYIEKTNKRDDGGDNDGP